MFSDFRNIPGFPACFLVFPSHFPNKSIAILRFPAIFPEFQQFDRFAASLFRRFAACRRPCFADPCFEPVRNARGRYNRVNARGGYPTRAKK